MLQQTLGSKGVAQAVGLCRPEVISCYPITPQTHIVEEVGRLVKAGQLENCEFLLADSEFSAMSAAIGASAAGARTYTATASQGILYMAEAVYNASGLGLPIVMTLGNRAIGAPLNIWNDHTDAMAMMDSGWLQLFVETNQQAADVHIQAFRLAEAISLPVMVCMDGFILTHAIERVDVPEQEQVDRFLPPFEPQQALDPDDPVSIGAMVGPEAFTEVRFLAHHRQMQALELIPEIAAEFESIFGRDSGGLLTTYGAEKAETLVISMGSIFGTICDVIDQMRDEGVAIGAISLRSLRPFPREALREAVGRASRVVVIEKSLAVGLGGSLSAHVHMSLLGQTQAIDSVIAGLGGRPITRASLKETLEAATRGELEETHFLDLQRDVVERELSRMAKSRRSGAIAENILRDLGVVAAAKTG